MYIQADEKGIKKVSNTDPIWKLVHDNKSVTLLKELPGKGCIGGDNLLFVAGTKEECLAEIEKLGLVLPKELELATPE